MVKFMRLWSLTRSLTRSLAHSLTRLSPRELAQVEAQELHPGLNKDVLSDASWTYAMYLESFAVLPQLYLFQKQARRVATVDYLVGHFVAALGFSPVWKSTSELGYLRIVAETFVNLNAIEQTQRGAPEI